METKTLKAHELEPGMTIYYCDAPRNQKKDSFRSAIVKEIYKHHIVVKTIPDKTISPRATIGYHVSLGVSSINCGDIKVKTKIERGEKISYEELVAEM